MEGAANQRKIARSASDCQGQTARSGVHPARAVPGEKVQTAGGRGRRRDRSHVSRISPATSETAARARPRRRIPAPSSGSARPSRIRATTRPTSSSARAGGSSRGAPSPLVSKRQPCRDGQRPTKRWMTGPAVFTRTTTSPTRTSAAVTGTSRTRSPSRSQGRMLIPRTGISTGFPSAVKSQSRIARRSGRNSSVAARGDVTPARPG
jgi:hypothetical protein